MGESRFSGSGRNKKNLFPDERKRGNIPFQFGGPLLQYNRNRRRRRPVYFTERAGGSMKSGNREKTEVWFRRTAALLAVLFFCPVNGMAETKPYATRPPLVTAEPVAGPETPSRDAEGFLAEDGEFIHEDEAGGLWMYLSSTLQVVIRKYEDRSVPLIWFETEIRTRGEERFRTVMTNPNKPGTGYRYPYSIARDEGFVLGFSDDFYAERMKKKQTVGIIIREGQIVSAKTNKKRSHKLPNLDMMIQYPDGRLEVCECWEHTAEELLESGAVNVFSFGPILIRDGEINEQVYKYYRDAEPRHALGMFEPGHYLLLSFQGRRKDSKGTMLQRLAEMMKEKGVQQALNLDGGNTMALIFRGKMLNKEAIFQNRKFVRSVTSLIGIGKTDIPR